MVTFFNKTKKIFKVILFGIFIISFLNSCGIYKKSDARTVPPDAKSKVKKNLEEGKGISLDKIRGKNKGTTYQFASSNPMWRATLEILDFLPLANVDYSGGIITTDRYNEGTASNESIKITVRFMTNEIRSDGIKIIIHKKNCSIQSKCSVKKIESTLENELRIAILKKAVIFEKDIAQGKKKFKRNTQD